MGMSEKEILKKKGAIAIEEYIAIAQKRLEEAKLNKDEEGVAVATYLVAEYEQMLEEFVKYYAK